MLRPISLGVVLAAALAAQGQQLRYSARLGGSYSDMIRSSVTDTSGNVYVAGETLSGDFPTTAGALQRSHAGSPSNSFFIGETVRSDAFIAKLSAAGEIEWSTYLGGSDRDTAAAIAVDGDGFVYVAGSTASSDFPTTPGAWQSPKSDSREHGFVAKLSPDGRRLVYATLLAGSATDRITGLALDSGGHAYVTGYTTSSDFPTTPGAWQRMPAFSNRPFFDIANGFVSKLNTAGTALIYSTFLTGESGAMPNGIAVDADGSAVVAGSTASVTFPITPGAYIDAPGARIQAFVSKVHFSGTALVWSTFLGASRTNAAAVALDRAGSVYVTGTAEMPDASTVFVTALTPDGALRYATILPGASETRPSSIAADAEGNVFIAGATRNSDLPVTAGAITGPFADAPCFVIIHSLFPFPNFAKNCGDAFFMKLDADAHIAFASYFAGNDTDEATAISVDARGSIAIAGYTRSLNLPGGSGRNAMCSFAGSPSVSTTYRCEDGFIARFDAAVPEPKLAIVHAATRLPGPIARGQLIRVVGSILRSTLKPLKIFVNGEETPPLWDRNAFSVTVPAQPGRSYVSVHVVVGDPWPGIPVDATAATALTAVAPGVFVPGNTGQGEAGSAASGGTLGIYVTGIDDQPAVYVGGEKAEILYAGEAPGQVESVKQINFVVPDLPPGRHSLFVVAGEAVVSSQAGVFITIRE